MDDLNVHSTPIRPSDVEELIQIIDGIPELLLRAFWENRNQVGDQVGDVGGGGDGLGTSSSSRWTAARRALLSEIEPHMWEFLESLLTPRRFCEIMLRHTFSSSPSASLDLPAEFELPQLRRVWRLRSSSETTDPALDDVNLGEAGSSDPRGASGSGGDLALLRSRSPRLSDLSQALSSLTPNSLTAGGLPALRHDGGVSPHIFSLGLFGILPYEVIHYLWEFLDVKSRCYMARTCDLFRSLARDDRSWRRLFERLFGNTDAYEQSLVKDSRIIFNIRTSESICFSILPKESLRRPEDARRELLEAFAHWPDRDWRWLTIAFANEIHIDAWNPDNLKSVKGPAYVYFDEQAVEGEDKPSAYVGDLREGLRWGCGIFWNEAESYVGQWRQNLRQGTGTRRWKNGNIFYGHYENNERNGRGRFQFANMTIFDGLLRGDTFVDGSYKWPNRRRYDGTWNTVYRAGVGTYWWPNGSIYLGNWDGDLRHGPGVYLWNNGDVFEGSFQNGLRVGPAIFRERLANGQERLWAQEWNEDGHFEENFTGLYYIGQKKLLPSDTKVFNLPNCTSRVLPSAAVRMQPGQNIGTSELRARLDEQRARRRRLALIADGQLVVQDPDSLEPPQKRQRVGSVEYVSLAQLPRGITKPGYVRTPDHSPHQLPVRRIGQHAAPAPVAQVAGKIGPLAAAAAAASTAAPSNIAVSRTIAQPAATAAAAASSRPSVFRRVSDAPTWNQTRQPSGAGAAVTSTTTSSVTDNNQTEGAAATRSKRRRGE